MKITKTLAIVALIAAGTTATAGSLAEPEMKMPIEVVEGIIDDAPTSSSCGGLIVPLLNLALVAAAAS